jgi:hypothetical protein
MPRLIPFLRNAGLVVGRCCLAAREPRAIGFSGESGSVSGSHCMSVSIVKVMGVEKISVQRAVVVS